MRKHKAYAGWRAIVSPKELTVAALLFLGSFFFGIVFWEIVL